MTMEAGKSGSVKVPHYGSTIDPSAQSLPTNKEVNTEASSNVTTSKDTNYCVKRGTTISMVAGAIGGYFSGAVVESVIVHKVSVICAGGFLGLGSGVVLAPAGYVAIRSGYDVMKAYCCRPPSST